MDKQSTIGFILIGVVLVAWMWWMTPPPQAARPAGTDTTHQEQHQKEQQVPPAAAVQAPPTLPADTVSGALGKFFSSRSTGEEKVVVVNTDLYRAEISTRGGMIKKWELKKYLSWDSVAVQLVDFDRGGDLNLLFTSADGRLVNTNQLYFDTPERPWGSTTITGTDSVTVVFTLPLEEGRRIQKKLTFHNGTYNVGVDFAFTGMAPVISNYEYQVVWEHGLRYTERNSVDESSYAMAYASSGGELIEVDAAKAGEPAKRDINGSTDWVGTRTKYFAAILMAEKGAAQGAYVEGEHRTAPDNGAVEKYSLALKMPLKSGNETAHLNLFLGPLDIKIIKGLGNGIDQIMTLGAAWIIRPIAEYVMVPLFQLLHMLIPNYGWVIIAFALIINVALTPLSRMQRKSMKRMQQLQPLMEEIKQKYADNQEKQSQAIMNLYREYGVNPASGCLPLLLQMPILFALYAVFRAAIDLRQAGFMLWIHDLSIPDRIFTLPFHIPFFNVSEVSGLALAMGVTMFVSQKMTVTDPRQKAMVWMMPVLMTLMFNGLPSGLNLYYFVFNLMGILQQFWYNRATNEEPLRKVDQKKKSGGIMARLAKDMPKLKQ
jgi:YidC/Oxa1 family membrane protein insertase